MRIDKIPSPECLFPNYNLQTKYAIRLCLDSVKHNLPHLDPIYRERVINACHLQMRCTPTLTEICKNNISHAVSYLCEKGGHVAEHIQRKCSEDSSLIAYVALLVSLLGIFFICGISVAHAVYKRDRRLEDIREAGPPS